MPLPLVPVAIGVGSFVAGVIASRTIKSRGAAPIVDESMWGEQIRVSCKDGASYDGALQDIGETHLTVEVGRQRFLDVAFEDIAGVNVIANL